MDTAYWRGAYRRVMVPFDDHVVVIAIPESEMRANRTLKTDHSQSGLRPLASSPLSAIVRPLETRRDSLVEVALGGKDRRNFPADRGTAIFD